ncbi:MAG: phosphoglycerate dehydrogenase [Thermoleophilia bacterium]
MSDRPRVLVREKIAEEGISLLRERFDVDVDVDPDSDVLDRIAEYDALIVRSATKVNADLIARATRLRVVGRAGVGVDNVDVPAATKRGILVANAPESTITSAAEHTLGLLLAVARSIPQAHAALKQGRWERSRYGGVELAEKTLGLVGFGRIGQRVARGAKSLGMRVVAYDPFVSPDRFKELGVEVRATVPEVLAESDFLSLHAMLTPETRGIVGRDELAQAKPGIRIVNVGRGELIDEEALVEALQGGTVAAAAIDVFAKEPYSGALLELDNAIVTPHLGASTGEAQSRAGVIVAEQVAAALDGGVVSNAVNVPAIAAEDLEQLGPFVPLASKLGELAVELAGPNVGRLEFAYLGSLAERDTRLLTAAGLRGAFAGRVEEPVNTVNAAMVARERGIEVEEENSRTSPDYTSLVQVTATAGDERTVVAGTAIRGGAMPRLVRVLGYEIELEIEPIMLFIVNEDKPGRIGLVGSILGEAGVNIANMTVSRNRSGGRALMALTVDTAPGPETLDRLRAQEGFVDVRLISLTS